MSVIMKGSYLGDKKVSILHEQSGSEIRTAAPLDNNGDGSSFSPTDLCAASLPSCMLTIMGIVAENNSLSLDGSHFSVEKHMSASPRRIGKLLVEFHLPENIDSDGRVKLENGAKTCPIHHSLKEEIQVELAFIYDVA